MAVKGETISFEEITQWMSKIPSGEIRETELFIDGDHWQETKGWIGWTPESSSTEAQHQFMLVERLFNPKNVIGGIVKRIQGATLGKEPDWEIVEKDADQKQTDPEAAPTPKPAPFVAVDTALLRWWDEKKVHKQLKKFMAYRAAYGKAAIRVYIPSGFLTEGKVGADNLDSALEKIFVEVPHPLSITNVPDIAFGRDFSIQRLPKDKDGDPDVYEICYLDEKNQTNLRQVAEATNPPVSERKIGRDLAGNMLVIIEGDYKDAMISKTVKRQQRSINHAKTGENFALANINFPETTFINADLPTEKKTGSDGKEITVVKPMAQGFGRWRNLIGKLTMRADGTETLATPNVVYRDGADPNKFSAVADNNTRDIHQECGMLYIYMADSEYASGESKIESMTDYLILLVDHKTMIDNVGTRLFDAVLQLAFLLSGDDSIKEKYKVIFSSKLTIGRVSNEDKKIFLDEVSKGLRSKRGYMVAAEVTDDPDGELVVIARDTPLKDDPISVASATAEATAKATAQFNPPQPKASGAGAGT